MPKCNAEALKLPDQLLVRYFRASEIDHVAKVTATKDKLTVRLKLPGAARVDHWRDLGGGIGYVPDGD